MFSSCPVFVTPICPRCGKGQFGIKELEVQNAVWKKNTNKANSEP